MAVYVTDPTLEKQLKAERQACNGARYDEVWEGVYFMPPLANNEHQLLATQLGGIFQVVVAWTGLGSVYVGVNVSDREKNWKHNYRCPDVAVFLQGSKAKDCGTHWCGGPDFTVEVVSPKDRSHDKIPFYSQVGVRELLLINRKPWKLELYQRQDDQLVLTGQSSLKQPSVLVSQLLPLRFRLVAGSARPLIEVTHADGAQRWLV